MELRVIDPKLHDLVQYLYKNLGVTSAEGYYTTLNLEESVKCTTGGANLGRPLFTCCVLINSKIKKKELIIMQAVHNLLRATFEGFRCVRTHNGFSEIEHVGITY